jgi:hypothetical protein
MWNHKKALLLATALGMVTVMGCADGGMTTSQNNPRAGAGGTVGNGGSGGSMIVDPGKPGTAFVSAGNVVSNAGNKIVYTLGQASGMQTNLTSPGYRLHGGLIGATQGK